MSVDQITPVRKLDLASKFPVSDPNTGHHDLHAKLTVKLKGFLFLKNAKIMVLNGGVG